MSGQVYVRAFFLSFDNFYCSWLPCRRIGQRHPNAVAEEMTIDDLKVRERPQRTKVDLLTARSIGAAREGLDVGGEVLDPIYLVLWQQNRAQF